MNAVTKTNDIQGVGRYVLPHIGLQNFAMLVLLMITIASAFAVICCRDTSRQMVSDLQALQYQNGQLKLEKNQFLAEQSALLSDQRVSYIAQNRLHMQVPKEQAVVMVKS